MWSRSVLLSLAGVLALGACGSSADDAASESTDTTVEAVTTTEAETTTTSEATTTTEAAGEFDEFCAIVAKAEAQGASFERWSDPVAFEAFLGEQLVMANEAIELAPEEMLADYQLSLDKLQELYDLAEAEDYDMVSIAAAFVELELDEEFTAATDRIEQFQFDECGIEPDEDVETTGDDESASELLDESDIGLMLGLLETETGRELIIEGMVQDSGLTREEAGCFIDTVDMEVFLRMGTGEEPSGEALVDFFTALDTCGIDPTVFVN